MVEHRQLVEGRRALRVGRGLIGPEALRALALGAIALALAACGGSGDAAEPPAAAGPPPSAAALPAPRKESLPSAPLPEVQLRACRDGEELSVGDRSLSYVAVARGALSSFSSPGGDVMHRFGRRNEDDFPTLFGVLGAVVDSRCAPLWYQVQLPVRPNGATGYVRARDVDVDFVTTWIDVDLSDRRVDLLDGGRHVLRMTAAIGAPDTPTPTGRFYVNQRLRALDPSGPFGPGGIGISAFSPVLTGWAQGGPIAIHGTNAPDTIGKAASNGCLRVDNETVERLFDLVPAGTPVTIRA